MTKENRLRLARHYLSLGNKTHPYVIEFAQELKVKPEDIEKAKKSVEAIQKAKDKAIKAAKVKKEAADEAARVAAKAATEADIAEKEAELPPKFPEEKE